jgi:phage baseplate assembly protein W
VNAKSFRRLGSDLALTRYVGTASAVALESADSWGSLDLQAAAGGATGAQALTLRLLTKTGSLTELGHPQYGSRLVTLIGQENNETNRHLARLYTIEALAQEPRVKEVTGLAVETVPGQPDTIRISFSVMPVDDDDPLALALEVTL